MFWRILCWSVSQSLGLSVVGVDTVEVPLLYDVVRAFSLRSGSLKGWMDSLVMLRCKVKGFQGPCTFGKHLVLARSFF